MVKKAIFFDFDGTLANSVDIGVEVYNNIIKSSKGPVLDKDNIEELKMLSLPQICRYLKIPKFLIVSKLMKMKKEIAKRAPEMNPFFEILELLETYKDKFRYQILSSNSKEGINSFLNYYGFDFFEKVVSVKGFSGKDKKLKKMVKEAGLLREEIWYVGDEQRDIIAANRAGIDSLAVCWGFDSEVLLQEVNPKRTVANKKEFEKFLIEQSSAS